MNTVNDLKKELEVVVNTTVEAIIKRLSEKDIEINEEDIKSEVEFDIYKCLSNYILDTDEIENISISKNPIRVSFSVKRDDISEWFETDQIIASGIVQKAHYRYIAKTNLRKLNSKLSILSEIENLIKYRSKLKRLQDDVNYFESVLLREVTNLESLEKKSKDEICQSLLQYKYNPENLNFESEEEWNKWLEDNKNECSESHIREIENTKKYIKDIQKRLLKAKNKVSDFVK
jgi:hypothetical protein